LSQDHLGNTRLVTDQAGNTIARHDYRPFGDEITTGYAGRTADWAKYDGVKQKFTGQEHDGETQFDFFQARYLSAAQQRFMSPDPGNAGADPSSPQSWNAYSYVQNNPLNRTDPSGFCDVFIGGIQMNPGQDATVDQFVADKIAVFPYSGTELFSGLWGVLTGMGNAAGLQGVRDAIAQTSPGEMTNVFTISGGSSTWAATYNQLSSAERARIGNVVYMIPGNARASLPSGNGTTLFATGGGLDSFVPSGRPSGYQVVEPLDANGRECGHSAGCMIAAMSKRLKQFSGSSCSTPRVITQRQPLPLPPPPPSLNPGFGGSFGGWNEFDLLQLIMGRQGQAESTITYH
jgi:RHS repeat-associated protein